MRLTSSGGIGAPPPPTDSRLDVSRSANDGSFEQIPAHRGHAHEVGHPFAFDQFERAFGIPLVRHHELGAADEGAEHHRHQAGHVEQRDAQHQCGLRLVRIGIRRLAQRVDGAAGGERHQRTEDRPVRRDGALRVAGGAGRVEDRHVVVGVDVDVGHGGARGEQILQCDHGKGRRREARRARAR
jgi:hypothetical protein